MFCNNGVADGKQQKHDVNFNEFASDGEIEKLANGFDKNGLHAESDTVSWNIGSTNMALTTTNPIRRVVENMPVTPNPDKTVIPLSIGDPTKFGNMVPPDLLERSVISAVNSQRFNGYAPSVGHEDARSAVAAYLSTTNAKFTAKDVVLASGCSNAIEFVIEVLANPGENILLPRPGFSLYQTIAVPLNIKVKYYDLLPNRQWEIDLDHLESQIDNRTRLIVVNNPSNPCGSVYTKYHLIRVLKVARQHRLPILADEVYAHVVFPGNTYYDMASLSPDVPIFSCGGMAKRFIVPGWRMGWVAVHDPCENLLPEVRLGLTNLSQRIVGPNTLIQGAMTNLFKNIPQEYFDKIRDFISESAHIFYHRMTDIEGLRPIMPRGAMYIMTEIDLHQFPHIKDDTEFIQKMVSEESVFCLPGSCFQYPGYFRSVLTLPHDKMEEACARIKQFCDRHRKT